MRHKYKSRTKTNHIPGFSRILVSEQELRSNDRRDAPGTNKPRHDCGERMTHKTHVINQVDDNSQ